MELSTIALYTTACFVGAIVPGPTSLLAMSNGTSRNWSVVFAGMLGAALSDILVIAAVGFGLGALLTASETAFSLLRWAGVIYLVWLSLQLWKAPAPDISHQDSFSHLSLKRAFFRSFTVALSNPKVLLFFSAFLPQFINPSEPLALQYALLAVISAGIDVAVMALYAVGGLHAAKLLSAQGARLLNRVSASVMFILAMVLALFRRSNA